MDLTEVEDTDIIEDALQEAVGAGFDWSQIVNAASEAANAGVQYKASQDASASANKASSVALAKATAADANWAQAEQQLDLAQQAHNPAQIAPAQVLQAQAQQQASSAGVGMSPADIAKRVAAAQQAAQQAAQAALSSPADMAKAAMSRAWQKVLGAAASPGSMPGSALAKFGKGAKGGTNWFTATHAGLPGYAWVGGGVVVGTGLILLIRAMRK